MIYTSGSTGRPKGTLLSHSALASHLEPYMRVLGLGPQDRVLLTSAFTFDMAYSSLFGALLCGGTLVVTGENPMVDPVELAAVLADERITFTTLVPSALTGLLRVEQPLTALRHLGCGGEVLPSSAAKAFLEGPLGAAAQLHNRYGPTECAVNAVLFGPFGPQDEQPGGLTGAPVGWPSAHRHSGQKIAQRNQTTSTNT